MAPRQAPVGNGLQAWPEGNDLIVGRRERTCRRRRGRIRTGGLLFGLWLTALAASGAGAQSLLVDRTALIDVHGGSSLDGTVWVLGTGSAPLDKGPPVNLRYFYTSRGQNVSATWLTELRPDFGITWGFQTGEQADKYHIKPAINLGIVMIHQLSVRSTLSFTATGVLGGWLQEGPCRGPFALEPEKGIQPFDCHLGSSSLTPPETLKYLANVAPPGWLALGVRYTFRF